MYNSLAMTNAGLEYNVKLSFSYELIIEHDPFITMLIFGIILCISTGLVGMIMFAVSICVNRTTAVLMGTFLSVLSVVFANLYLYQQWISFISPFSWINLLLLYGKVCKNAPFLFIGNYYGSNFSIYIKWHFFEENIYKRFGLDG